MNRDINRDENGKPLEVKEGIVIDESGNELTAPPGSRGNHRAYRDPFAGQRTFVFKTTNPLAPIIVAPLLLVAMAVGLTLFTGVAAAVMIAWIFYLVIRAFRRL